MKVTILFIDDNAQFLRSIGRIFSNNPAVNFAECHNVEDAITAIVKHNPDVIFLDHHLTENGDEGFRIIDQAEEVLVYSTSSDYGVRQEYRKRGIESIDKGDFEKIKETISKLTR